MTRHLFSVAGFPVLNSAIKTAALKSHIIPVVGSIDNQNNMAFAVGSYLAEQKMFLGEVAHISVPQFEDKVFKDAGYIASLSGASDIGYLALVNFGVEIFTIPKSYSLLFDMVTSRAVAGRYTFIGCRAPVEKCFSAVLTFLNDKIGEQKAEMVVTDILREMVKAQRENRIE